MKLSAPNVYLFAYHLIRDQPKTSNPLWQWYDQQFLPHFQGEGVTEKLKFPTARNAYAQLIPQQLTESFSYPENSLISGFVEPLQLQDSYALFLNIGYDDESLEASQVEPKQFLSFVNPQDCLKIPTSPDFLGQTILITICCAPTDFESKSKILNLKKLADETVEKLYPNQANRPIFARHSQLLGSPIFEYGLISQINETSGTYPHVLVWFQTKVTEAKFGKYQHEMIDLMFYFHKIIKSFQDSRKIYQLLERKYEEIDEIVKQAVIKPEINQELQDDIKQYLSDSVGYTKLLRHLEDYQNTILINNYNYQETLKRIYSQEKDGKLIRFLATFYQKSVPYFVGQIKGDLGYFEHGTDLLDRAINTIRGIVEIEQAKREKSLQKTIEALGIGIGAGGIFASATSGHINSVEIPLPIPHQHSRINLPAGLVSVTSSFIVAIVGGVIVAKVNGQLAEWLSPWHKWRQSRLNSSNYPGVPAPERNRVSFSDSIRK